MLSLQGLFRTFQSLFRSLPGLFRPLQVLFRPLPGLFRPLQVLFRRLHGLYGTPLGLFRARFGSGDVRASRDGKRYHGLKNQGATCYLNTVLQCFYMTQEFRQQVERQGSGEPRQGSADLLLQLQKLFEKLKKADGTTKGITRSLCIKNVYKQQDAVEYYQKILKAVGPQLSQVFEGKMSNKSKCLQKEHIFQERCSFITIPLAIEAGHDEVYKVEEGLEAFFKHSQLDEDNWLYCDQCDKKTETETWNEIEEFPTALTLHLKRFDFDYMQMKLVKNPCPVDIPLSLHIKDYEYDLYAVMNHSGDQSGGHYNAVIKSFEDNQWYCFDDSSITECSVNSLQKSRLPYIVMYRKRVPHQRNSAWEMIFLFIFNIMCLVSIIYRRIQIFGMA